MFYGITNLSTFVVGAVIIVLLPGPNSLYVMSVASRAGVAAAYRGACGIFLGDGILMFASAMGIASLLRTIPYSYSSNSPARLTLRGWASVCCARRGKDGWQSKRRPLRCRAKPAIRSRSERHSSSA